jgi:alpha-tubulin suppressor-like RCC1 family protein
MKRQSVLGVVLITLLSLSVEGATIALGGHHSCALLGDGTVKCWGFNVEGGLGDGTTIDSFTPVSVSGITTATSAAVGDQHSCTLLTNGKVMCWGIIFKQ